jgi:hypothetical protein
MACVLYAAIVALLFAVSDPVQAASVLFVIPIALLALSDGVRGGAAGALLATVLVAIWVLTDDIGLTALGWFSRVSSFAVVGLLVGRLGERYAGELHDRVVQSLVVASYQMRDGGDARAAVDSALAGAREIISQRLGDVEPGDLRLGDAETQVPSG